MSILRKNLGGQKRGRKKTKYGKYISAYLSNEVVAKLNKMSSGKPTAFIESLILAEWERKGIVNEKVEQEVQQILGSSIKQEGLIYNSNKYELR